MCEFLKEKGYEIIDRNFYTRFGEIDIIAKKGDVLHFIEVRSAGTSFLSHPVESITEKKKRHFVKSIQLYLKQSGWRGDYRADLVTVVFSGNDVRFDYFSDFIEI